MEVRTAIKTKPLTKTHNTSFKAGNVDPGQADCNKTMSSSGQTQPSPGQGLRSQGWLDVAPVPPTTWELWPSTSHSGHCALRMNEWFANWWLTFLLSEFSEMMVSIWCCGLHVGAVLCLDNCCYLKREPQLCGRECDAGCYPPSEMKDLLPSLLHMLPEISLSCWAEASGPTPPSQ